MSIPVIIVGDESKRLDLVKAALKNANLEVITVSTGYELTSSIFKYKPSLVIFYPSTQWINCFEFVKEIKKTGMEQNTEFLFLCDKTTEINKEAYEENGIKCIGDSYQMSDFIKHILTITNKN